MRWIRFAVLSVLLFAPFVRGAVEPVWTDGYLTAGEKTVGTAVRFMRVGMWSEAERELRRSLGYRPENHAAQFNLGVCHLRKGQLKLARRFFQKAIKLRPERLYCEALAQLDSKLGTGAEFHKFLIPCTHECDHGYAFARAGLWKEAETRFATALADTPSPVTWLNRAVACEVLGRRSKATRYLSKASSLQGRPEFDQFAAYLSSAPDFPLDMLVSLPDLTTATEAEAIETMYVVNRNTVVRRTAEHDSSALTLLEKNMGVSVLENTGSWYRIRTKNLKEGYVPAFLLSSELVPDTINTDSMAYSRPYKKPTVKEPEKDPDAPEPPPTNPTFMVRVQQDGNAVAVRTETSLMAEIVGYVDPGRKLRVKRHADKKWLEIVSGRIRGFILSSYVETL